MQYNWIKWVFLGCLSISSLAAQTEVPASQQREIVMSKCSKDPKKKEGDCDQYSTQNESQGQNQEGVRHRRSAAHKAVHGN